MPGKATDAQVRICTAQNVEPAPPLASDKAGIALTTLRVGPLNGMRIRPECGASGWYIWGGAYSEASDFFAPLHHHHMTDRCPAALPFMALPPGWRFLVAPGHVDVWFDPQLLNREGEPPASGATSTKARLLSRDEFQATFADPMRAVVDAPPPFDFWPYIDAIPSTDLAGFDASEGEVDNVWADATGRFEHVLINTTTKNVFLVIVLDLVTCSVHGHLVLNLNEEYGITP